MELRVIHLNIYHKLPEDFNGGVNDALRALADHRESKGIDGPVGVPDNTFDESFMEKLDENSNLLWPVFLEKIKEGFKTVGAMELTRINLISEL